MFSATREWLAADPAHVLTLVVDELHLYRGTQGSEVAMIVRNLCDRFGLEPDSPQLKIVATSASLDSDRAAYLETVLRGREGPLLTVPANPRGAAPTLPLTPDASSTPASTAGRLVGSR